MLLPVVQTAVRHTHTSVAYCFLSFSVEEMAARRRLCEKQETRRKRAEMPSTSGFFWSMGRSRPMGPHSIITTNTFSTSLHTHSHAHVSSLEHTGALKGGVTVATHRMTFMMVARCPSGTNLARMVPMAAK